MKKNTSLAILAIVVLDAIATAINEATSTSVSTSKKETIPTTEPKDANFTNFVSREVFGEEEIVGFLVDEVGLDVKSSYADYPPTAKMMVMSIDEVRQIKEYCDNLKKKAEFGDKVMKNMKMLMTDFSKI